MAEMTAEQMQEWLAKPFGWDCVQCYTASRADTLAEARQSLVMHHIDNHFHLAEELWPTFVSELEKRSRVRSQEPKI